MSDSLRKEMDHRAGPGGVKCWCCGPGTRKADRAQFRRAAKRAERRRARQDVEASLNDESAGAVLDCADEYASAEFMCPSTSEGSGE